MNRSVANATIRTPQKTLRETLDDVRGRAAKILPGSDPTRSEQNPDEKAAFLALIDEARIRAGL
jgi:hypothetical protein